MKKRIYLETTIISYLTSRPSRDLVIAARQRITRQWRDEQRGRYELFISELIAYEAGKGNPDASVYRKNILAGLAELKVTEEAEKLGDALIQTHALPAKASADALHIHLMNRGYPDLLLTWNCSHIANANKIGDINKTIILCKYQPPVICTPEELMGEN
ncbi:MAG: type II toxin-antitoxin system VapC family toxin [Planctomycetes bacterium]|nr:type II toxin-antitoxin system VapC family toxin [Planctomycetota bacterium]